MEKAEIEEMLELVYPLESPQKSRSIFRKSRKKKVIFAGLAAAVFLGAYQYRLTGSERVLENNRIVRPLSGSKEITLMVSDGIISADVGIEVASRLLVGEELLAAAQAAFQLLQERVKGDNPSLLEVSGPLVLVEEIPEYDMEVVWDISGNSWIKQDGTVWNEELEEAVDTILQVQLIYNEESIKKEMQVRILPYPFTAEELFGSEIKRLVAEMAETTAQEEYLLLPEQSSNGMIVWKEKEDKSIVFLAIAAILSLVLVYTGETAKLRKKIKEREEQLLMDYPEFLSKFLLLLDAGMNVKGAWERMIGDYKKSGRKRSVYDEMVRTMTQMEVGMPESRAYEQFGRRCALLPYLRFTTILNQNLRKGSKGIAGLLQMEANEAFSERKEQARRRGEEAGTKLLLPMGGMLAIVLIIILVPAFASFH